MVAEGGALKTFLIADVRGFSRFTNRRGDEAAAQLAVRFADIVRDAGGRMKVASDNTGTTLQVEVPA